MSANPDGNAFASGVHCALAIDDQLTRAIRATPELDMFFRQRFCICVPRLAIQRLVGQIKILIHVKPQFHADGVIIEPNLVAVFCCVSMCVFSCQMFRSDPFFSPPPFRPTFSLTFVEKSSTIGSAPSPLGGLVKRLTLFPQGGPCEYGVRSYDLSN